jgi:exodeoxyribonuclease-3
MPALKIATWNVNSLRLRLPQVLAWLNTHQPDALCLQETKVEDGLFPLTELQNAGWHAAFTGQKSYNGVAILARVPPTDIATGFTYTNYDAQNQARLIGATVQGVRLYSAYVPNGESLSSPKFEYKATFYTALQTEMQAALAAHPQLVLSGDFNIAADARDVPNPARAVKDILFTPTEQAWLKNLQTQTGLADAFRIVDQTPHVYSWFDYRSYGRNPSNGMRIDYHLVSPALAPQVQAVTHYPEVRALVQPSDHVPVMLVLKE